MSEKDKPTPEVDLETAKTIDEKTPDEIPFFDGEVFIRPGKEIERREPKEPQINEGAFTDVREAVAKMLEATGEVARNSDNFRETKNPLLPRVLSESADAANELVRSVRRALGLPNEISKGAIDFPADTSLIEGPLQNFYTIGDADILSSWRYPISPGRRFIGRLEEHLTGWGFPESSESAKRLARDIQLEAYFLNRVFSQVEPTLAQLRMLEAEHRRLGTWLEKAIDDEAMASRLLLVDKLMNDVARLIEHLEKFWTENLQDRDSESGRPTLSPENLSGAYRGIGEAKAQLEQLLHAFANSEVGKLVTPQQKMYPHHLTRRGILHPIRQARLILRRRPNQDELRKAYELVRQGYEGMVIKPASVLPNELEDSLGLFEDVEEQLNVLRTIFSRQSNITPERQREWDSIILAIQEDLIRLESHLAITRLGFLPAQFPPTATFERFRKRHVELTTDLSEAQKELARQAWWKAFFKTGDHKEAERHVAEILQQIEKTEGFLDRLLKSRFQ